MSGKFITAAQVERQQWPGMGDLGLISKASETQKHIFADLVFAPEDAFNFHHHPNQEEVLYVMEGSLEAWIEKEKMTVNAGDTLYLPAGTVHAVFNVFQNPAKMFVILTPIIEREELGFELVDVSEEEPWKSLRQ